MHYECETTQKITKLSSHALIVSCINVACIHSSIKCGHTNYKSREVARRF